MSVSVVIPTCNRPAMLERALASVRRQTRAPDEIIVVSDGHDHPGALPGCRVLVTGPRAGGGTARNVGAQQARGDWLAFLDDDDEWHPTYLESGLAQGAGADVVLTGFQKVRADGEIVPEKVPPTSLQAQDWFVRNQGLRGSNLVIRCDLFWSLGGFDEVLASNQDLDIAIRLAERGPRYRFNAEKLVTFNAHGGQRISTPGSLNRYGQRTYLAMHGHRMTSQEVQDFRERTRSLFSCDPGPVPTLVWVLGPPGGGKSTWARRIVESGGADILHLADLLSWTRGADRGVLAAKRHLAQAVRAVELERGPDGRRLLVDCAYLPPELLRPLDPREHVVAIVPPKPTWKKRILGRDRELSPSAEAEYDAWAGKYGVGSVASFNAASETL